MDNNKPSLAYEMLTDLQKNNNYLKALLLVNVIIIACLSVTLYIVLVH